MSNLRWHERAGLAKGAWQHAWDARGRVEQAMEAMVAGDRPLALDRLAEARWSSEAAMTQLGDVHHGRDPETLALP